MVDSSERVASLGPYKKWGDGNPQANDTTGHTEALNHTLLLLQNTGVPSEATIAAWIAQVQPVNPNFKFALKMKKSVTHGGEGSSTTTTTTSSSSNTSSADSSSQPPQKREHYSRPLHPAALAHDLPLFFARASLLPPYLRGPILFQFPPSFPLDLPSLHRLATALPPSLPSSSPWQLAFEFRHPSWFCSETYSFLHSQNWALVLHALPQTIALTKEIEQLTSSSFVYLRLHGLKEEHAWDYSKEELAPYVEKVKRWRERGREGREESSAGGEGGKEGGKEGGREGPGEGGRDVYVFFLNDAEGKAPENALVFGEMVAEATGGGEKGPRKPEAGMQITRFFGVKKKGEEREEGGGGEGGKRKGGGEEGEGTMGAKRSKVGGEEEPKKEEGKKEAEAAAAAAAAAADTPPVSSSPPPSPKGGRQKTERTPNKGNSSSSGSSSTPRITQFFGKKREEKK